MWKKLIWQTGIFIILSIPQSRITLWSFKTKVEEELVNLILSIIMQEYINSCVPHYHNDSSSIPPSPALNLSIHYYICCCVILNLEHSILHSKINLFKRRFFYFVTYTIIQSSEMCSLHLTHPSEHTPGAVISQRCSNPGSSWGFGALLMGLTSVVDNSCQSRDSNPQPRVTSPTLYLLGHNCPWLPWFTFIILMNFSNVQEKKEQNSCRIY